MAVHDGPAEGDILNKTPPPSQNHSANSGALNGLEANFSTLVLSIGSSAAMALGLAPNPANGKVERDLNVARFNIDLLRMLKEKTKGNLTSDEQRFVESICTDLQTKFCSA